MMMRHRHLVDHDYWSKPKIDDVLERGTLADWDALRVAVEQDRTVAADTLVVVRANRRYGTSPLWERFILRQYPEFIE